MAKAYSLELLKINQYRFSRGLSGGHVRAEVTERVKHSLLPSNENSHLLGTSRGNRRQLIRQILDQLPEGGAEDDEAGLDDADMVVVDQEADYDADPDRPVNIERAPKHRYAW